MTVSLDVAMYALGIAAFIGSFICSLWIRKSR
jgi:hypothetical protein